MSFSRIALFSGIVPLGIVFGTAGAAVAQTPTQDFQIHGLFEFDANLPSFIPIPFPTQEVGVLNNNFEFLEIHSFEVKANLFDVPLGVDLLGFDLDFDLVEESFVVERNGVKEEIPTREAFESEFAAVELLFLGLTGQVNSTDDFSLAVLGATNFSTPFLPLQPILYGGFVEDGQGAVQAASGIPFTPSFRTGVYGASVSLKELNADPASVPEPSILIGLLTAGSFVSASSLNRKRSKSNHA